MEMLYTHVAETSSHLSLWMFEIPHVSTHFLPSVNTKPARASPPPRIVFPSFPYRMENKSIYRGEEQTARYSNFVEGSIKSSARISYAAYSGPSFILQLRGCQIT